MPIIKVELFKGRSPEQKALLAKEITETVTRVMNVKPESTHVIFYDVEKADWAHAGVTADKK
jgi:4-oxalocrotonate tautomerase